MLKNIFDYITYFKNIINESYYLKYNQNVEQLPSWIIVRRVETFTSDDKLIKDIF